jgi:hypothetical protein
LLPLTFVTDILATGNNAALEVDKVKARLSPSGSVTVKGIGVIDSPKQVVRLLGRVVHTGGLFIPKFSVVSVGLAQRLPVKHTITTNTMALEKERIRIFMTV